MYCKVNGKEYWCMNLKDNYCKMEFFCTEPKKKECVYFMNTEKHKSCKFKNGIFCNSLVAQVNRMTLTIKKLKGL